MAFRTIIQLAHAEAEELAMKAGRCGVNPAGFVREGLVAGEAAHATRAAHKRLCVAGHALFVIIVASLQDRAVEVGRRLVVPAGFVDLRPWCVWCGKVIVHRTASRSSQTEEDSNGGTT